MAVARRRGPGDQPGQSVRWDRSGRHGGRGDRRNRRARNWLVPAGGGEAGRGAEAAADESAKRGNGLVERKARLAGQVARREGAVDAAGEGPLAAGEHGRGPVQVAQGDRRGMSDAGPAIWAARRLTSGCTDSSERQRNAAAQCALGASNRMSSTDDPPINGIVSTIRASMTAERRIDRRSFSDI